MKSIGLAHKLVKENNNMIRFYTGETAKAFVEINADIKFPENG